MSFTFGTYHKVGIAILFGLLLPGSSLNCQQIDLRKYAIDAEGTIFRVVRGEGILSEHTRGEFGPEHPETRWHNELVRVEHTALDNNGRATIETRRVKYTEWVRTQVTFPEFIFIEVDPRGLVDDAHWGKWTIYEIGTYTYGAKTVKRYTINPQKLINILTGVAPPAQ